MFERYQRRYGIGRYRRIEFNLKPMAEYVRIEYRFEIDKLCDKRSVRFIKINANYILSGVGVNHFLIYFFATIFHVNYQTLIGVDPIRRCHLSP